MTDEGGIKEIMPQLIGLLKKISYIVGSEMCIRDRVARRLEQEFDKFKSTEVIA